jgi:hypothetical protein
MKRVKQVKRVQVQLGGETHSGWLPENAAAPLPTPVENLLMDVEIFADGDGYLLCYTSNRGNYRGDFWFHSIDLAEQAAFEWFEIEASDWID